MSAPFLSVVARRAATEHGGHPAFVASDGAAISYAELDQLADECAAGLAALGMYEGSVVALTLPSTIDYVVVYLGAARIGAVTAGINPALTQPEVAACLESLKPAIVIRSPEFTAEVDDCWPSVEIRLGTGVESWAADLRATDVVRLPDDNPDRPVCVCFTSGSTGSPKAAYFCDRQLEAIAALDGGGAWGGGGRGISSTQFAHVGFMTKLPWMIAAGRTTHLVDRWSAGPILELISAHQMTAVTGVAPQIALLLRHPDFDSYDFTHVAAIVVGGAASPPALVDEARQRFGAPYSIRYSSTESGGIGLGTALDANDAEALHTIGRPRPGVEIDIRDPDGATVRLGEIGHLWLRSPAVMAGYWNDAEATSSVLQDGWLNTGDLALLDAAGCTRLAGRAKEMYIRGGYNVYPMEVEAVLVSHPAVAEIAVVPRHDSVMGEIGVAVVVPETRGEHLELEALRALGAESLARHKLPEAIWFIDALPRNATDKVDRRALTRLVASDEP